MGQRASNESKAIQLQSSINHINQSLFEQLVQPLFVEICTCLEWQDTLLLRCMSKQVQRMFDPTKCCRACVSIDTRLMYDTDRSVALPSNSKISFTCYAHRLVLQLGSSYGCDRLIPSMKQIAEQTSRALLSGSLHSLYISEIVNQCYPTMLSCIRVHFASPSCRLQELRVKLSYTISSDENWSSLKQCTSLKYLHVDCPRGNGTICSLFQSLPTSLEEFVLDEPLRIAAYVPLLVPIHVQWMYALRSNEFLPMLRRFRIEPMDDLSKYADMTAQVLICTVMKQTNVVRPISSWYQFFPLQHVRHLPLHELVEMKPAEGHFVARLVMSDELAHLFAECPSDLWPNLERLSIQANLNSRDMHALSCFTSQRNITDLDLCLCHMPSSDKFEILSCLPALRVLTLGYWTHDTHRDSTEMFRIACCRQVEVLCVHCEQMTIAQIESVVKAVPHCRKITLRPRHILPTLLLAMVLHSCQLIEMVTIKYIRRIANEHFDDVREAFERYPFDARQLHNLVQITILAGDSRCDAASHYLLRQLSSAPRLEVVKIFNICTRLRLAMLLQLPHYRDADQIHRSSVLFRTPIQQYGLFEYYIRKRGLICKLYRMCRRKLLAHQRANFQRSLGQCVEILHAPSSSFLPLILIGAVSSRQQSTLSHESLAERILKSRNDSVEDVDAYYESDPAAIRESIVDTPIPVFTPSTDSQGLSGRERFALYVRRKLSWQESSSFTTLNAGHYSRCIRHQSQQENCAYEIDCPYRPRTPDNFEVGVPARGL